MAYSVREAEEWWSGLSERERDEAAGLEFNDATLDQGSFW